jgi:DNA polymerase III delta prime subunit
MSNDQPQPAILLTPTILTVPQGTDQQETAIAFLQEQLHWDLTPTSPQLKLINQTKETISIETIRELVAELAYASHLGKPRAIILLHADLLSIAAQHAFLKSLEEPPINTQLILATTSLDQLLPTIRSRCLLHHHQSAPESFSEDLPELLENLLFEPKNISYSQLIELVSDYKDRQQAATLVKQMLFKLHGSQKISNSSRSIKLQKQLLETLKNLEANANVRLALEGCFFTIKNTI